MPCCGSQRQALSRSFRKSIPPPPLPPVSRGSIRAPADAASAPMLIRYVGNATVVVRGPATNRQYAFPHGGSIQPVDARDAVVLLRDKRFGLG